LSRGRGYSNIDQIDCGARSNARDCALSSWLNKPKYYFTILIGGPFFGLGAR
jgi:hypothetical protein